MVPIKNRTVRKLIGQNVRLLRLSHSDISKPLISTLRDLTIKHRLSAVTGELTLIGGRWYVTHAGLLQVAARKRCHGICVEPVKEFCDSRTSRFAFCATVYTSPTCKGFAGYGDADPSNISISVQGAEMRVAETRAVNRALRKAYGIGICSIEEIGSFAEAVQSRAPSSKLPPQPANGNYGGPKVRDRLYQIIRHHQLDPVLVKSYAVDFCGTKTLRDASREQVENFVVHLADWAEKNRNALLCQLNNYARPQEGAA